MDNPVLDAARAKRAKHQSKLDDLLTAPTAESRSLTDDETTEFEELASKITKLDAQISMLEAEDARKASAVAASAPAGSVVQQVITAVQALVPLAAPLLPAGSVWGPLLQAALSLVPEIAAAAGLTGAATVPAPKYTPAQARALLTGGK